MPETASQIFDADNATAGTSATASESQRDPVTGQYARKGITPHLVTRARKCGLTKEDLAEMSPADIRDFCRDFELDARIDKRFAMEESKRVAAEKGHQAQEQRQVFQHGLNADNANPQIVEALDKMRDHYEGVIAELEKRVGGVQQFAEGQIKREAESFGRRVERCFAKHPEIFGTGPIDQMDRESIEFDFRMAAVKAHRKAGNLLEELEDNIESFVKERFSGKRGAGAGAGKAIEEDRDETAEWEAGVLGRPTQAGPRANPPGREKAANNLRDRLAPLKQSRGSTKGTNGVYLDHSGGQGRAPGSQS